MRNRFSRLLTDAALADDRILMLTGDHGYALFDEFRKECPDQFINCGIAEQNMVGVAAGLAKGGFKPIVYGLSAFVPMRVLEQIKMDVCYENLPVVFIGDGAGIVYGQLGASHQSTEDIATLRAVPNIDIYSPADRFELEYCFHHMLKFEKPNYFRFGKADCGDIHAAVPNEPMGNLLAVRSGVQNYAIIATGSMVSIAAALSDSLGQVEVWSMPSIASINQKQVMDIASRHETVFVLEEHSIHGGAGSLIAEIVSEKGGCKVIRMGIADKFSEVCGDYKYLMKCHGLDQETIQSEIVKATT